MAKGTCSVQGCSESHYARGWCRRHYRTWRRRGTPTPSLRTPADRFWAKVEKTETCWLWTGSLGENGYGHFLRDRKPAGAHRVAYEWLVGPIPIGLEIDHLCRVRNCVNPAHMEPVTHAENIRRAEPATGRDNYNGAKTHCAQGHPFDRENTASVAGRRVCRICRRAAKQRWDARNDPAIVRLCALNQVPR